jgi:rubrerythrin
VKSEDVLKKAVEMEEHGRVTYLSQAEAATDPLLKALLLEMSDDEKRHRDWFSELLEGVSDGAAKTAGKCPSLEARMMRHFRRDAAKESDGTLSAQEAALQIAMDLEKASYDFYTDLWRNAKSEADRTLFDLVRREEYDHMVGIENMLYYLTRTSQWLDREESKRWNWMF